jgi:hypothetical protein
VPEFEAVPAPASVEPMEEWSQWGDTPTGITDMEDARAQAGLGGQIFAVRKVQSLYQDMITVGRTANHDIVLRDPSVSKFHAHFKVRPSGIYLVDAGSTRGTFVDGKRLWPRDVQLVVVGAVVGFGALRFRLCTPESTHAAVRAGG